jgi:hypothetical protein
MSRFYERSVLILLYRVIRKSLCIWWLQYRKLQVLFRVSTTSLQTFIDTRFTLTPSAIPNSNYVIMVSDWKCLKYFFVFYCNHQTFWSFCIFDFSLKFTIQFCMHLCVYCLLRKSSPGTLGRKVLLDSRVPQVLLRTPYRVGTNSWCTAWNV